MARRGRVFFYLGLIIILGLIVFVVVWQRFLNVPKTPAPSEPAPVIETVNIVVVTQRVERGGILSEAVLEEKSLPQTMYIQGMITSRNEVIGRQVKFDLEAGIPLTASMLVNETEQLSSTGSNAALAIPRGMVAISIPIDRLSAVSYAPEAGDHVNVLVTVHFLDLDTDFQTQLPNYIDKLYPPNQTGDMLAPLTEYPGITDAAKQGRVEADSVTGSSVYIYPSEAQRPRTASQTLLQDAVILHMGEFDEGGTVVEPTPTPQGQTAEGEAAPPPRPEVVTLIVGPQEAVTLNYLVAIGADLTLVLRAAGDDARVQTEAVTLQFLLDQYRIPVPVKLPYGLDTPFYSGVPATPIP